MSDEAEDDWLALAKRILVNPDWHRFDPSLMLRICVALAERVEALTERLDLVQHYHSHPMSTKTRTGLPETWMHKPPGVWEPEPRLCGSCEQSFTGPHICEGKR